MIEKGNFFYYLLPDELLNKYQNKNTIEKSGIIFRFFTACLKSWLWHCVR